jgi:hypothetical protein
MVSLSLRYKFGESDNCEMRLCNAAQNETHIKSDDEIILIMYSRYVLCNQNDQLPLKSPKTFTAGQTPNILLVP